jgi:hypothetical protein
MEMIRDKIQITLNMLIVILVIVGTIIMLTNTDSGSGLTSSGVENLKYFTVLSNEFCGIVALIWLIFLVKGRKFPVLFKLMSVAAVGLTFLIIAAFLAPMYSELNLYAGSNLFFHLIVPLVAMVEFLLIRTDEKIPFRYTFISASLSLIYGFCYYINIQINGIGEWPDTNDWYGFLNWGYPVGFMIYGVTVLMNWGMACILRLLNKLLNSSRGKKLSK